MSNLRYLVLAIVVAALLPSGSGKPSIKDLDSMVNKTVCATVVKFDIDPNRVPYKIKTLKCADHTDDFCVANNIDNSKCCHKTNGMACVELQDKVLVSNRTDNTKYIMEVSVGCACTIQTEIIATNADKLQNIGS